MNYIVGVDEAGRGAWAGPMTVGAVVLDDELEGLTDSKILTKENRKRLSSLIYEASLWAKVGWVWPDEIDKLGLTDATKLAIERAIQGLDLKGMKIIIDGNINYLSHIVNSRCIIKADQSVPAVSAASIIAKVARDEYMTELSDEFPKYGFDKHVGYGTKAHSDNLKIYGICEHHRLSFKPIASL